MNYAVMACNLVLTGWAMWAVYEVQGGWYSALWYLFACFTGAVTQWNARTQLARAVSTLFSK